MKCPDFEPIIIDIARDSLMDAATRERGLDHVRGCARCAILLGEERALSSDLRALSAEDADDRIPERVETALLAAFRERAAGEPRTPIVATRNRRRMMAVAALALFAFGLALAGLKGWTSAPQNREPAAVNNSDSAGTASIPAESPTPERAMAPPMVAKRKPDRSISRLAPEKRGNRSAQTSAGRRRPNDSAPDEYVTQFFPVIQGGELIPLESGRIVRVKMPRSNLIPFGIPFNQERANETIKADVLLSNDGLARAIRLVY